MWGLEAVAAAPTPMLVLALLSLQWIAKKQAGASNLRAHMPATAASNWFNYICLNSPRTWNQLKRSIGCKETYLSWGTTVPDIGTYKPPCCDRMVFPSLPGTGEMMGSIWFLFPLKLKTLARAVKAPFDFYFKLDNSWSLKDTLEQHNFVRTVLKPLGTAHLQNMLLGSGLRSKPCLYKKGPSSWEILEWSVSSLVPICHQNSAHGKFG